MNICVDELNSSEGYLNYDDGYRIVYYYKDYHEVPNGIYALELKDFTKYFDNSDIDSKDFSLEYILDKFLKKNEDALGVAIYRVDGSLILKKIIDISINEGEVYKEELIYDYGIIHYDEGFRIVYFYTDDNYSVGAYARTLEAFMINLVKYGPIDEDTEFPKFTNIEELLGSYLNDVQDAVKVAIYDVKGNLISSKERVLISQEEKDLLVRLIIAINNNENIEVLFKEIDVNKEEFLYYLAKINTDLFNGNNAVKEKIDKYHNVDNVKLIFEKNLIKKYISRCYQLGEYVNIFNKNDALELVSLNEKVIYYIPDSILDIFFMIKALKENYRVAYVLDGLTNKKYYLNSESVYKLYINGLNKMLSEKEINYDDLSIEIRKSKEMSR